MRKILIIVSKDIIRRNILDTNFWSTFTNSLSNEEKIILVVNEGEETWYEQYKTSQVIIETYKKKEPCGFQKLLGFLIRTGINSHSTKTYRKRAWVRHQSTVGSYVAKTVLANTVGRSGWYKSLLRGVFLLGNSPKRVYDLFDLHQPSLVFVPSLIDNEFDAQFARVAKQKGVKLVGMVRSWDNLNNHGVLSVVPDVFYFQNEFLVEAAQRFQGISISKIKHEIIGLPHYDMYFDPSTHIKDKVVFFHSLGLDPNKKLILLGGSDFYYSEDSLPAKLNKLIETGSISDSTQVLFRPHPSSIFLLSEYGLDKLTHVIVDDAFSGKHKFTDQEKFINLLFYSDIVINIASTLSIDAAVFGKPAICINFDDPDKKISYYESVHRLYDTFDHYEQLVATGGVKTPESVDDLAKFINQYFEHPSKDAQERKKIVKRFVSPFDGNAGVRLATKVREDIDTSTVNS